jgi:hypothetical protein
MRRWILSACWIVIGSPRGESGPAGCTRRWAKPAAMRRASIQLLAGGPSRDGRVWRWSSDFSLLKSSSICKRKRYIPITAVAEGAKQVSDDPCGIHLGIYSRFQVCGQPAECLRFRGQAVSAQSIPRCDRTVDAQSESSRATLKAARPSKYLRALHALKLALPSR